MKIYNKYIVLAAMALTFAACTQEDDFTPQTDNDAVKINATIGKLQTRVAYEDDGATNFINGDKICVQNTLRDTKNIATYTFDGTTWTTTDAFVWNGSAKNQFKAWYPAATASFDSFDLPTDQSAGIDKADWMTAETEEMTKPGSGVLDLNFVHKLTKVTVTVSFNSQYPAGDNYVSMLRFFTNEETPVEVTPYESKDGYTAILLPGVYAEEASFITLEMNFEDNLTVPVNSTLIAGLEAGKHYNFHLTVGKDAVGISKVRVLDWDEEEIDGGVAEEVIPNTFDATAMTAEQLNATVAKALDYGHTELAITLAADADATMFSAITAALAADGIEEGSIDLTISGAKTVPEYTFYVDKYVNENWQAGATLRSVTLTDATTIGSGAFYGCAMTYFSAPNAFTLSENCLASCENLTDVNLPSVQSVGLQCFYGCISLRTISLPECIDLGEDTFNSCETLETVYAPKATNLGPIVFFYCTSLTKVTLGSVESVNQKYDDQSDGLFIEANDTKNIDLVLSSEQKVMTFDSSTKYWKATDTDYNGSDDHNNKSFIGYTFKSVTLQ